MLYYSDWEAACAVVALIAASCLAGANCSCFRCCCCLALGASGGGASGVRAALTAALAARRCRFVASGRNHLTYFMIA